MLEQWSCHTTPVSTFWFEEKLLWQSLSRQFMWPKTRISLVSCNCIHGLVCTIKYLTVEHEFTERWHRLISFRRNRKLSWQIRDVTGGSGPGNRYACAAIHGRARIFKFLHKTLRELITNIRALFLLVFLVHFAQSVKSVEICRSSFWELYLL